MCALSSAISAPHRFNNGLSSRAFGEGPAVDRYESGDRQGFPLVPLFRSLPRASYFSFLVKRKVTKRKHTPSVAPGAARRVRVLRGVFRQYILVLSKNAIQEHARRPVARPSGLIRESRRNQGPRQIKINTLVC
jgi:hypothetical protein